MPCAVSFLTNYSLFALNIRDIYAPKAYQRVEKIVLYSSKTREPKFISKRRKKNSNSTTKIVRRFAICLARSDFYCRPARVSGFVSILLTTTRILRYEQKLESQLELEPAITFSKGSPAIQHSNQHPSLAFSCILYV